MCHLLGVSGKGCVWLGGGLGLHNLSSQPLAVGIVVVTMADWRPAIFQFRINLFVLVQC